MLIVMPGFTVAAISTAAPWAAVEFDNKSMKVMALRRWAVTQCAAYFTALTV